MRKPKLSLGQIINMSLGFLGIQFGFGLQNANASRIFSIFGADVEHLSWFWIAAPLTGMIVQPIIGHYSDKTWTRLGRRRPFFLAGAILASIALIIMPNSSALAHLLPPMFIGAGMLMIMDASINVSMEPFRALVADLLPSDQRTLGFSVQTTLIGIGAVLGSWLPYILANWIGISNEADPGQVPDNVIFSFYIGAVTFIATIVWTVVRTKEYPPDVVAKFEEEDDNSEKTEEESKGKNSGFVQIAKDFVSMPKTMKQLGVVQFFSWFAMFSIWVFSTPAIAVHVYGCDINDTSSKLYQDAGDMVGWIFGVYNGIAAIYAILLPTIAKFLGRRKTHALSLIIGGIALASIYFIKDPSLLIYPMIGIGISWASILAMPYAILAGSIPVKKMGIYMGLFNFFITIPQIINGIFGGLIVKRFYESQAIYAIVFAGISLAIAAISVLFVDDKDDIVETV